MIRCFFFVQLLLLMVAVPSFAQDKAQNGTEVASVSETIVIPADYKEEGMASWYGEKFQGKLTASGEPYDMERMTAAHNYLPLGVKVNVTNLSNKKKVAVIINDRGPFVPDRIIDLSRAAAQKLGFIDAGKAKVLIEPYRPEPETQPAEAATSAPVYKKLYGAFYIQAGAYKVKANADRLIERLNKAGFHNTRTVRVVTDSAQIFKVQLGMYKTLANARKAHISLGKGFPGTFILADVIQD
ncbi:septal ring lytic transglycosylase RlpA family protein [Maridesulfovibrio salexigens]|uniref:Probable endolytic peptidoglycan transglycosylase RlpA n=1 Tax=Maridesulfovibrio salexigens (strain ATCC 14822 / DSM 2638 / NCIMB 8403 / VKM B-1763) TaxID=526222 RepID=C6BYI2_MARSD|nr:septal ring lytic transglycosylase RlpA family protein [Maridesulfovibrio salexigens]ACS78773.1 rare lipoprotein A [Maridesulfovibrio salexigens DSM 2638]